MKCEIKELNCLYKISHLFEENITLDETLQKICEIVQMSFFYDKEITSVKIDFNGKVYKTDNYKHTKWSINKKISVDGFDDGLFEVSYIEKVKNLLTDSPFTEGEIDMVNDISGRLFRVIKRKMDEQELIKTKEEYQSLFRNMPVGFYRNNLDGKILLCNEAYAKIWGKDSVDEMYQMDLDRECKKRKYPRDKFIKAIKEDGEVINFVTEWRDSKGEIIWTLENSRLLKDKNGKPKYFEGMIKDITKRKIAENRLMESYMHLGSINRQVEILANLNKYKDSENKQNAYDMILKSIFALSKPAFGCLLKFNNHNSKIKVLSSSLDQNTEINIIENFKTQDIDCIRCLFDELSTKRGAFSDSDIKKLKFIHEYGLKYYIALPLLIGKKLLGEIVLCFRGSVKFTLQELEFYEVFANQSSYLLLNLLGYDIKN